MKSKKKGKGRSKHTEDIELIPTCFALNSFLKWYKAGPCADCGKSFHTDSMELDHNPDRGTKIANVGWFVLKRDQAGLWLELAKCDLVCVICHRTRTRERACWTATYKLNSVRDRTTGKWKRRRKGDHGVYKPITLLSELPDQTPD